MANKNYYNLWQLDTRQTDINLTMSFSAASILVRSAATTISSCRILAYHIHYSNHTNYTSAYITELGLLHSATTNIKITLREKRSLYCLKL